MSNPAGGNSSRILGTVLLVDDEAYVRESLASVLARRRLKVKTAASVAEALRGSTLAGVDVVVTDLKMPGEDGLALVRRLAESEPALQVIVLTGHGTVTSAVECVKAGAFDYLLKPTNPDELAVAVERAMAQAGLKRELDYLRAAGAPPERRGAIGVSEGWREVLRMVDVAAPVDTSVLLLGESGTGKEEVAKILHARSGRAEGPFVRVNCAAIPAELFESEFFGHRRGSFTGAVADREGRFRVAHGGTLFMDEINSLPAVAQAKVLRVLQDGTFERVGDSQPTAVDVRLICASNADLDAEVEAGRFRADLFYRVNVMTITVPPLRERRADIPLLAEAFLAEFGARFGKPLRAIHRDALAAMEGYSWPGNVRELRNVVERGVLLERGEELQPSSLPFNLLQQRPADGAPLGQDLNLRASVAAAERRVLEEALHRSRGVRREAARLLGIDERNMAYFLRKHGLMERRGGP